MSEDYNQLTDKQKIDELQKTNFKLGVALMKIEYLSRQRSIDINNLAIDALGMSSSQIDIQLRIANTHPFNGES